MRTIKLFLGPVLFVTAACLSSLLGQEPPQAGTIQGVVTRDGTNDPIADVRITVVARGSLAATGFTAQQVLQAVSRGAAVNPELVQMAQDATQGGPRSAIAAAVPLTTVTDSAGRFTVANVPAGEHYVRAQLQGYFGPPVNEVSPPLASVNAVVTSQQTSQVRVSLVPAGTISGRITDAAGKPILNAPALVLQRVYEAGTSTLQMVNARPTDDRGEFRISLLPPGEYYLAASPVPGGANSGMEVAVTTMYPGVTDTTKAIPISLKGGTSFPE